MPSLKPSRRPELSTSLRAGIWASQTVFQSPGHARSRLSRARPDPRTVTRGWPEPALPQKALAPLLRLVSFRLSWQTALCTSFASGKNAYAGCRKVVADGWQNRPNHLPRYRCAGLVSTGTMRSTGLRSVIRRWLDSEPPLSSSRSVSRGDCCRPALRAAKADYGTSVG